MEGPIMGLVIAFIGVSIMLTVGVSILGGVNNSFDCSSLSGNATEGWQKTCNDVQGQTQSSFVLLIVILIVIAAIAILVVVRML